MRISLDKFSQVHNLQPETASFDHRGYIYKAGRTVVFGKSKYVADSGHIYESGVEDDLNGYRKLSHSGRETNNMHACHYARTNSHIIRPRASSIVREFLEGYDRERFMKSAATGREYNLALDEDLSGGRRIVVNGESYSWSSMEHAELRTKFDGEGISVIFQVRRLLVQLHEGTITSPDAEGHLRDDILKHIIPPEQYEESAVAMPSTPSARHSNPHAINSSTQNTLSLHESRVVRPPAYLFPRHSQPQQGQEEDGDDSTAGGGESAYRSVAGTVETARTASSAHVIAQKLRASGGSDPTLAALYNHATVVESAKATREAIEQNRQAQEERKMQAHAEEGDRKRQANAKEEERKRQHQSSENDKDREHELALEELALRKLDLEVQSRQGQE